VLRPGKYRSSTGGHNVVGVDRAWRNTVFHMHVLLLASAP
jgi:hypothetical protein